MSSELRPVDALRTALTSADDSTRLRAALAAGTEPHPDFVNVLVEQFATEPEFLVRDMLTWALIQQDRPRAVARVLAELDAENLQAKAQALHALSKLAEPSTWEAITDDLLFHADSAVARTAWRTAVVLVPVEERSALAVRLCTQLGRGDHQMHLSLSRELVNLGDAAQAAIAHAETHPDAAVRSHAFATSQFAANPDSGFEAALDKAKRLASLQGAPLIDQQLISHD